MATQSDNTNTGVVATIVVVGTFSMIAISALLTTLVRSAEADMDAVRPMHADLDTIASLDQQQAATLHGAPRWVDQKAGKVGIPIERAMQLVIQDLRKDPAAASPPIPPGLVLPPQPPADGSAAPGTAPAAGLPATSGAVAPGAVPPGAAAPGVPGAAAPAAPSGAAPAPAAPHPAPTPAAPAPAPAAPHPAPTPPSPAPAAPHAPGTP
jgi:hypothetical protein